VSKLYYDRIFSTRRVEAMYETLVAEDPQSPLIAEFEGMREWMRDRPYLATTQVPCGDFFEHRDRALRAHASQVSPDSSFFFWPNELQRKAWPYEDYQLVTSLVESSTPETDLFTGITDPENGTV
jgi:mycothiol S-conjugate amidase